MAVMTVRAHIALNAHLLSREASYRSAGIHGYLFNTLAHLPRVAPDLAYTLFVGSGQPPEQSTWVVRRSRLPTRNPWVRIIWEQCIAPLELGQIHPDLVHGMAFSVPFLWNGLSVVTIFDLSFIRYPARLSASRRLYLHTVTRASAHRARRVVAISQSSKAEICTLLGIPETRVDVALPGVSPDFRPVPADQVVRFRVSRHLAERFILYVGTVEPRKNLDTLLRAYAVLPERKQIKMVLAGGIGWRGERVLKLVEELGLGQDVLMPGYVHTEELPLWYSAAELFVYPSVYEGFGMPVLEAMACGTPVMASDTSSLPEVIGPVGILLPPTNVEVWTKMLTKLLSDQDLRIELSARGRKRAGHFTWENTARETVASYYKALG